MTAIKLLPSFAPHEIPAVAVSGGMDSMGVLSFLQNGRYKPMVVHFDHGTKHGREAKEFVQDYCADHDLKLHLSQVGRPRDKKESWEEFWRNERYKFLFSLPFRVATAHHLDDVVETWVMGWAHGNPKFIKPVVKNVIRPFLLASREGIKGWVRRRDIPFIEDPSNSSTKYARNRVRHKIIPQLLKINPGMRGLVRKLMWDYVQQELQSATI